MCGKWTGREAAQTDIGLTGGGQDSNLLYFQEFLTTKSQVLILLKKIVKLVEEKIKDI